MTAPSSSATERLREGSFDRRHRCRDPVEARRILCRDPVGGSRPASVRRRLRICGRRLDSCLGGHRWAPRRAHARSSVACRRVVPLEDADQEVAGGRVEDADQRLLADEAGDGRERRAVREIRAAAIPCVSGSPWAIVLIQPGSA